MFRSIVSFIYAVYVNVIYIVKLLFNRNNYYKTPKYIELQEISKTRIIDWHSFFYHLHNYSDGGMQNYGSKCNNLRKQRSEKSYINDIRNVHKKSFVFKYAKNYTHVINNNSDYLKKINEKTLWNQLVYSSNSKKYHDTFAVAEIGIYHFIPDTDIPNIYKNYENSLDLLILQPYIVVSCNRIPVYQSKILEPNNNDCVPMKNNIDDPLDTVKLPLFSQSSILLQKDASWNEKIAIELKNPKSIIRVSLYDKDLTIKNKDTDNSNAKNDSDINFGDENIGYIDLKTHCFEHNKLYPILINCPAMKPKGSIGTFNAKNLIESKKIKHVSHSNTDNSINNIDTSNIDTRNIDSNYLSKNIDNVKLDSTCTDINNQLQNHIESRKTYQENSIEYDNHKYQPIADTLDIDRECQGVLFCDNKKQNITKNEGAFPIIDVHCPGHVMKDSYLKNFVDNSKMQNCTDSRKLLKGPSIFITLTIKRKPSIATPLICTSSSNSMKKNEYIVPLNFLQLYDDLTRLKILILDRTVYPLIALCNAIIYWEYPLFSLSLIMFIAICYLHSYSAIAIICIVIGFLLHQIELIEKWQEKHVQNYNTMQQLNRTTRTSVASVPIIDNVAAVPITDNVAAVPITDNVAAVPIVDNAAAVPIVDTAAAVPITDNAAAVPIIDNDEKDCSKVAPTAPSQDGTYSNATQSLITSVIYNALSNQSQITLRKLHTEILRFFYKVYICEAYILRQHKKIAKFFFLFAIIIIMKGDIVFSIVKPLIALTIILFLLSKAPIFDVAPKMTLSIFIYFQIVYKRRKFINAHMCNS